MTLSVTSFFNYYMFHPEKAPSKEGRVICMITTIALGVLTFGLTHLICYAGFYHRLKEKAVKKNEEKTETEIKIQKIVEQKIERMPEKEQQMASRKIKRQEPHQQPVRAVPHPENMDSRGKKVENESVEPDETSSISKEGEVKQELKAEMTADTTAPSEPLDEKSELENPEAKELEEPLFLEDIEDIKVKAEEGKVDYQYALGCLYLFGKKGLKESRMNAKYWFGRAARGGDHKAMLRLGKIYYDQRHKDSKMVQEAAEWFSKSSEGCPEASDWLERCRE